MGFDVDIQEYDFPEIDANFESKTGLIYPWNIGFHYCNQHLQLQQARESGALKSRDIFTTFDANGQMQHRPFDEVFAYFESGEADYNDEFNQDLEEECPLILPVIG
ncbi:MAG: hypothetical protein ACRC80_08640 [Waterburya sp.]